MAILTEGEHRGGYLVSEANGSRSRGTGIVLAGEIIVAGQVVGIVTASGKFAHYDAAATDGTEVVAGISYNNVDATDADFDGAVFSVRDSEANGKELTYQTGADAAAIATTNTGLKALGIIVR